MRTTATVNNRVHNAIPQCNRSVVTNEEMADPTPPSEGRYVISKTSGGVSAMFGSVLSIAVDRTTLSSVPSSSRHWRAFLLLSSFYRLHSTFKMFSRCPRFILTILQRAASAVERSISASADFSSMTSKQFNSFIVHSTDFILHSKCSADVLDSRYWIFNVQLQQ